MSKGRALHKHKNNYCPGNIFFFLVITFGKRYNQEWDKLINIDLIPLVGNLKHSKLCADLVVLSVWRSEYFPSLQHVLCTLKNIGLNWLGLRLMKFCAWGSCHSWNPVPLHVMSSRNLSTAERTSASATCLLNLVCLVLVQREKHSTMK